MAVTSSVEAGDTTVDAPRLPGCSPGSSSRMRSPVRTCLAKRASPWPSPNSANKASSTPGSLDKARQLTEDIALGLQAKLLLEAGNSDISDAFIASRLHGSGRVYGLLPRGLNISAIVARSTPQVF